MEPKSHNLEELIELDKKLRAECMALFGVENKYFDYGTAGYRSLGRAIKYVFLFIFKGSYYLRLDLELL